MNINSMEQVGRNLWEFEGTYYRLFGHSITPNGCYLAAPKMVKLDDIDTASGRDVFSSVEVELEFGTVPSCHEFMIRPFVN